MQLLFQLIKGKKKNYSVILSFLIIYIITLINTYFTHVDSNYCLMPLVSCLKNSLKYYKADLTTMNSLIVYLSGCLYFNLHF